MLSVIVPTYNEEKDISACIESLLKQSYKDIEIIIIDDGSIDKTRNIVKNYIKKSDKIKLIEGEHRGPGFSRNLAAKKAKGEILVFVDADMTFHKKYLKELTKPIINKKFIGTEENQHYTINKNSIWSKIWGDVIDPKNKVKSTYEKPVFGVIFRAIRKDIFEKYKGFDPSLGYADDQTFYLKFNLKSFRVEDAICYHKNPETLKKVYNQSRWIGSSLSGKSRLLKMPVLNLLVLGILVPIAPFAIPFLTIRRTILKKHKYKFPQHIIFISVRYFGTIVGIFNSILLKKNYK